MADIIVPDGSWAFDGAILRIVPGAGRSIHQIRKTLGELALPLEAIAGAAFEPGRKGGHLRLRLRKGADPLTDAVAGQLSPPADPYRLAVPSENAGAAEYLADEIRDYLSLQRIPNDPCEDFLLPGPAIPIWASAGDASVSFDGERVRLEWSAFAKEIKKESGPREFSLTELTGVEWNPQAGMGYGSLRFRIKGEGPTKSPEDDTRCVSWGVQRYGGTTALVAAAVLARLPRHAPELPAAPADHDALVRRLADLGALHKSGVITEEEFSAAKQGLLRRLTEG